LCKASYSLHAHSAWPPTAELSHVKFLHGPNGSVYEPPLVIF
jgi:hypothetical protein